MLNVLVVVGRNLKSVVVAEVSVICVCISVSPQTCNPKL